MTPASKQTALAAHRFEGVSATLQPSAQQRSYGAVTLWSLSGQPTEFTMSPESSGETLSFVFVEAGVPSSKMHDEPWLSVDGGLVIAPDGIERRVRFTTPWRINIVQSSRAALAGFVPRLPSSVWRLPDRRPLDLAMQAFVNTLSKSTTEATAIETYACEQLLLEMAGAVLLDRLGTDSPQASPATALRERALAVIAQQRGDPDLTPAQVAREVQSSLRRVQVTFADAGTTVAGEIRRQRARLAYSLLTDSRYDVLSVEQIAERSGFGTTMSLRRALHDLYRANPRALRAQRGE